MISRSRRDSVGGGGEVVAGFFRGLQQEASRRDSVGGGVVAEFFRDLQGPTRFSGRGGVVAGFFRHLQLLNHIFTQH